MKILMIHTGGTISCKYENGVLTPRADIAPTIEKTFENYRDVSFVHKHLCSVLSESTDGVILTKIVSAVKKYVLSEKYDGVTVTLGSDALAYVSAAISYSVGLSKTPCITVCSDLPLSDKDASGHRNIKAAVAVIRSRSANGTLCVYPKDDGEVSVFRASRIMQQPAYFSTPVPVGELYGTVKDGEFIKNESYKELPDSSLIEKPYFSPFSPVMLLSVYPGMIYPSIPKKIKAVILGTYHSGTLNTDSKETVKFARSCKKKGVRVYVSGISDGADYESMRPYSELGFIRLPICSSPSAMLIKLWMLNSKAKNFSDDGLFRSLGGDITEEASTPFKADKNASSRDINNENTADGGLKVNPSKCIFSVKSKNTCDSEIKASTDAGSKDAPETPVIYTEGK